MQCKRLQYNADFSMATYWIIFINLDTGKLTYVGIEGLFYQSEFDRLGKLLDLTIFEWPLSLNSMNMQILGIHILHCLKLRRPWVTLITKWSTWHCYGQEMVARDAQQSRSVFEDDPSGTRISGRHFCSRHEFDQIVKKAWIACFNRINIP